jgi:hypothetical protein
MFADFQRQLDDLSGQLQALTHLMHIHTQASLRGGYPDSTVPSSVPQVDGNDG